MSHKNDDIDNVIRNIMGTDPSHFGRPAPATLTEQENEEVDVKMAPLLNAITGFIDLCKQDNLPIDYVFHHRHVLSSTDGDGAFIIISHYNVTPACTPPGHPQLSAITTAIIRCHDNLRNSFIMPSQAHASNKFFDAYIDVQRRQTGVDFRPVSYAVCKQLIRNCLLRMKKMKKVLIGKDQRTITRLYDLDTSKLEENIIPKMPTPSPSPSVESLWIMLHRPEYFPWTMVEELVRCFGQGADTLRITKEKLARAMRYVAKDNYRRQRMCAMLEHQSLWHMLGNESEVVSWLLWELQSIRSFDKADKNGAIVAMENNIIFQLMINKFFKLGCGMRTIPKFENEGEYGLGMGNYYFYRMDLMERGTLPPNLMYTASIAKTSSPDNDNGDQLLLADKIEQIDISKISKSLRRSRNGCAICGATRFKGGDKLKECPCRSVVYCCRDHQILHWKKGGHKQECAPI